MSEQNKQDRRVQRTRKQLQRALMQLIDEKGYDAITIQDITDRANVGRTTFYLHYDNKDALFLDHHDEFSGIMMINRLTRDELLSDEPQAGYVNFLQQLHDQRETYHAIVHAKDSHIIMRGISSQLQHNLTKSLKAIFDSSPTIPMEVLTHYVVNAQLSTIEWWLMQRNTYSAYDICKMLQQLRRATICDAYKDNPP